MNPLTLCTRGCLAEVLRKSLVIQWPSTKSTKFFRFKTFYAYVRYTNNAYEIAYIARGQPVAPDHNLYVSENLWLPVIFS